ncbi:MAG TPA: nuclear transport factor 2 family protein [Longimicrobiales bacterium]|nr:nuclear transport factor 2 family protein [Longimicrobiales bacterium]
MSIPAPALAGVVALSLGLSSCARSGPSPRLNENEIVARTLMSLWETGDTEELARLFYGDAVYDDFPNQTQYRGLEEIAGYLTHVHDWADGVSMGISEVHVSETGAVVEWVFSAMQDKPIGSVVPVATGREVLLNGVTILEIEAGRIRRAADYIDVLPLVLQLGAEVRLPGGSIMKLDLLPLDADPGDPTDSPDGTDGTGAVP